MSQQLRIKLVNKGTVTAAKYEGEGINVVLKSSFFNYQGIHDTNSTHK